MISDGVWTSDLQSPSLFYCATVPPPRTTLATACDDNFSLYGVTEKVEPLTNLAAPWIWIDIISICVDRAKWEKTLQQKWKSWWKIKKGELLTKLDATHICYVDSTALVCIIPSEMLWSTDLLAKGLVYHMYLLLSRQVPAFNNIQPQFRHGLIL